MDTDDLGDGWVDATGHGSGPTSDRMKMNSAGITLGGLLLRQAGLEVGDRVRVLVNTEKQMVRVEKAEDGETSANKISRSGKHSGNISAKVAARMTGIEEPQELEVLAVEDGDIVGGYK